MQRRFCRIRPRRLRRERWPTCDLDIISVIKEGTSAGLPALTYSPRLIIIILMSKREDLLSLFTAMAPDAIKKLTPAHKNHLLALFHAHLNDSRPSKHKRIHKYHGAASYRAFVRSRMPGIIRRAAARASHHSLEGRNRVKCSQAGVKRRAGRLHAHLGQLASEGEREDLNCAICLEILVWPVLTGCGHAFCYQCLDESQLFSSNCPICRESIKGHDLVPCALLDTLIHAIAGPPRSPTRLNYEERVRKWREWRSMREVDVYALGAGMAIDVRDTESIWCEGTVVAVESAEGVPAAVLVHFNRWHNVYNEIIELPSHRLAPLHHFSSRTDIPRYNLALPDNNMRGLVVTGPPPPPRAPIEVESSSSSEEEEPRLPQIRLEIRPINVFAHHWDWINWLPPEPDLPIEVDSASAQEQPQNGNGEVEEGQE